MCKTYGPLHALLCISAQHSNSSHHPSITTLATFITPSFHPHHWCQNINKITTTLVDVWWYVCSQPLALPESLICPHSLNHVDFFYVSPLFAIGRNQSRLRHHSQKQICIFQIPGYRYYVSDPTFQILGFMFQVSGSRFHFQYQGLHFRFWKLATCFRFRVEGHRKIG